MLRSLWLLCVYISFIGLGSQAPFVLTLGYVWVDTFQPQNVAFILLNQFPVALVMGAGAFLAYFAMDRRSPPRMSFETGAQLFMAFWMTVTCIGAPAGEFAWSKWDWAFKSMLFAAFVPYSIRSRIQLEAFAQTYVFSLAANFIPFGIKTLMSGGGYGINLGLQGGNSGLAEGGCLSTVCLMAVPLAIYAGRHSLLMPKLKVMPLAYFGIALLAVVTAIGTYERSALIGVAVLGLYMFMRAKRKFIFGIMLAVMAIVGASVIGAGFMQRINSTSDVQTEGSAYTRILVWKWTLDYVATHPMGGGFNAYVINRIDMPDGQVQYGRAFHSISFEVLGETGWPGFGMFIAAALSMMITLRRLSKRVRKIPELEWAGAFSDALQSGMAVFLTSGAFVGIAFQPMFWYFISMGISLRAYVYRVEHQDKTVLSGWRAQSDQRVGLTVAQPEREPAPVTGPQQAWRGRTTPLR